ncbi:uroporphyrinogen-III C-methyltransferase [Paludisphaera mucosa]|uniref:uroporphyrinogen-III C-methyltransferase n=1 Tax=Paludisphaera mucosa TaxID=3030827 RepID=A0ABT6F4F3_9BACT|nr:uroporphyrinogen-III C-methyltransferase [Paludisphaera mucosa]MDG3002457.1 uroporphyrinogen-III C-methyltransferase [Paludisphaera mucosa]
MTPTTRPGIVHLVGAGPGDPGLLTLRGAEVLARADVVVFDHLANERLLDLAPAGALRIRAGKSVGHCTLTQDQINHALAEHAAAGKAVVRLKGGDPLVFGRGAEEAAFLRERGIPFAIVPGVTAGVGATACAGIPVTSRGTASAVAFITGHQAPEVSEAADPRSRLDWPALAEFPGTLVFYMGVTHLADIARRLLREGKPAETPSAVVESGSTPAQRVVSGTLGTIADLAKTSRVRPPALLVVGDVVTRREDLAWFEARPLFGLRIVVTRPREEAERSAAALEAIGAEVLIAPTVEILPLDDLGPLDAALDRLGEYDWLVFTSSNGVRRFLGRLLERGGDLRALGGVRLAAIGPSTAEALARFHLRADLIPPSFRSESLAEALGAVAAGSRILLARADRGRTILKDELGAKAQVDQVAVYRNADAEDLPPAVLARIEEGSVDWITLSSSAITARLHALLSPEGRRRVGREVKLATISPVTTATANGLGWDVAVEAPVHTWDGLVEALAARVASSRAVPE